MKKIKVTQVRSIIGRDETQKRTIQALGLGKINRSRIHNDLPSVRGMINKVQHLVMVEDVVPQSTTKPEKKTAKKKEETKTEIPEQSEVTEKTESKESEDVTA